MKSLRLISRYLLGFVFVFSGLIKANDPLGSQYKIADYFTAWSFPLDPLSQIPLILAIGLAAVEFCLGLFLVIGLYKTFCNRFILVLMSVMTLITLWLAIFNPISDCGCFGDVIVLTNWQTFFKNIILLVAAIILNLQKIPTNKSYTRKQFIIGGICIIFFYQVVAHTSRYLPLFDFRPYSIGTDIKANMEPSADGKMPKIMDFYIETLDGEDMTEKILEEENIVLFICPFLQQTPLEESDIKMYNALYSQSIAQNQKFYCLTASDKSEINKWQKTLGVHFPILHADDITLKTIIRSNPGIVELQKGVVKDKYSYNDIDSKLVFKEKFK